MTVQIRPGDTGLPEAGMTAGSSATMGVGSAVHAAANELNGKLAALRAASPGQQTANPGGLAGYILPGNADIGDIDVHFVDDLDEHASPSASVTSSDSLRGQQTDI